jgi:DNA-binding transcriptional regulator WhiA
MENVFAKKPVVKRYINYHGVRVYIYEKHLASRLGIPAGNKANLTHHLPNWITSQRECQLACLKGLFEAEGSLCIHLPTYTYNFAFANTNQSLLDDVEMALLQLGLHPERRHVAVRLRRKNEVEYFRNLIKFRE